MEKHSITVYDYSGATYSSAPWHAASHLERDPVKYEVDAWCLGGPEGVRAFFFIDDSLYEAHGDDGHWWLIGRMSKAWLAGLKKVVAALEEG